MQFLKDTNFDSRVRFHHFEISGTDGAMGTIAYVMDKNKSSDVRQVRFACSFCAPEDQFSKKKGRAKSHGRLLSENDHHTMNISLSSDQKGYFTTVNNFLRNFCLTKTPTFNVLKKSYYALGGIGITKVSELPDVCMFLDSKGHIFEKKGTQIIDMDGDHEIPHENDVVLSVDESWLNDTKNLVK
jgi:hypothetical protein